jgi:hypothetical protein
MCSEQFEDANMLLYHTTEMHKERDIVSPALSKADIRVEVKVETEKCPKCFKRFSIEELPKHLETEHFE